MKTVALLICVVCGITVAVSQSWTPQTSGTTSLLQAVWFIDSNNGWVVGDAGVTRTTTNGGQTWNSVGITAQDLSDISFVNPSTAIIVGDDGLILRTITSGISWSVATSGTASNLRTMSFGDGGMAYIGGRDGVILRSTDNGFIWTGVESGTVRYRGSAARGTGNAWIVGEGGVIRATSDGGISWFSQAAGTGSDLHCVFFLNTSEGWVGGQNNTLLYTGNGGATWIPRNSGITVGIDGISFINSNDGWAVGDFGTIYRTTDGGQNWTLESSGTTNTLEDVFFVDASNGWTVGDLGTILFRSVPAAVEDETGNPLPEGIRVAQNFPNPFNPTTTIAYSVGTPGRITLKVYNLIGQPVTTLVDAQHARGQYTVKFDARELTSGIYMYRIERDGATSEVRKMSVLK